jgi:hypothetical protein
MTRTTRLTGFMCCVWLLSLVAPTAADAQRRGGGHYPAAREGVVFAGHPAVREGVVFVGGYFYNPFFGAYPWWSPAAYPYPYVPVFDNRAEVRVLVTPKDAAVYVDGFYAGIVDDFNGVFQRLPLPPGGHEIVLYLQGYRTVDQRVYLAPGSTFKLQDTMERLPVGQTSEPPPVAPAVPPPPVGSYAPPRTPAGGQPSPAPVSSAMPQAATFGTLALRVQPANASMAIDGEGWTSSDGEHFAVQVPPGAHRVEVFKRGYQRFSTDIQVREGETMPLNVSLSPE